MKSQLSFPIGGIVAFPVGANPSRNSDNWLECNGQSFNTSKYPELYKILGSNRVPNYQGMFLRGYGSQSYSQNNGTTKGTTNTVYSSKSLGSIQGDSARQLTAYLGVAANADTFEPSGMNRFSQNSSDGEIGAGYVLPGHHNFMYSVPRTYSHFTGVLNGQSLNANSTTWSEVLKRYKYTMSCSGGGEGESVSCNLNETVEYPTLTAEGRFAAFGIDSKKVYPTDNEFRPANIAVKYWIRSR